VASYITGPTRDQNSHDTTSLFAFLELIKANNSSSLITCTANTQPIPRPVKKVAYDWLASSDAFYLLDEDVLTNGTDCAYHTKNPTSMVTPWGCNFLIQAVILLPICLLQRDRPSA